MRFEVETITPQKAAEYLKKNRVNRNIRRHTVDKYAEDMRNGAWELNGESICFSENGELKDGQHRLMAIIKAGVPIKSAVCRGVKNTTSIYDIGNGRSVLDTMTYEGCDKDLFNSANMAVARLHYLVQKNQYTLSVYAARKFINDHKETLTMLAPVRKKGHTGGLALKNAVFLLAMMYALESGESYDKIKEFAEILATGFYEFDRQTPAIVLRNDFLLGKIVSKGGGSSRKSILPSVENAIYDFCREQPRKRSYANSKTPIYSSNLRFAEFDQTQRE